MTGVAQALHELALLGYRAWAEGENIRLRYEGDKEPEADRVTPLLTLVKEHKVEAIDFLARKPQTALPQTLTCYVCGHFRPAISSPNPLQAWGRCEKRKRGRYGVAKTCEALVVLDPRLADLREQISASHKRLAQER